jgi:hypothetical protein
MTHNAQQGLGMIGILATIVLFNLTFIGLVGLVGIELNTNGYGVGSVKSCDCGTITCNEYSALYGDTNSTLLGTALGQPTLEDLCASQDLSSNTGFTAGIITGFTEVPILSALIIVMNLIIIFIIVLIVRGING